MNKKDPNVANEWARRVWGEAVFAWEERKQDFTYRDLVARPGVDLALTKINPKKDARILDVGCAEGKETLHIYETLIRLGWSGKMFGHDPQKRFIKKAKKNKAGHKKLSLVFGGGSLAGFSKKHTLIESVDLVTSIFVLQDLPHIKEYIWEISKILKKGGIAIFLAVHPDFAEKIKRKGAISIERNLGKTKEWRFAGKYPIVEEEGRTFYVPYFHRTIEDYRGYFLEHFQSVKIVDLKPSVKDVHLCEKQKRSPFYNHFGNVYYPEIVQEASSALFIALK